MAGYGDQTMKKQIETFQDLLDAGFEYDFIKEKNLIIDFTIPKEKFKLYQEYVMSCFERNKNSECHREMNKIRLCKMCPKAEKKEEKK